MHISENVTYAVSSTCCLLCQQEMQNGCGIYGNVCAHVLLDSAAGYDDGVLSHADRGKDPLCEANDWDCGDVGVVCVRQPPLRQGPNDLGLVFWYLLPCFSTLSEPFPCSVLAYHGQNHSRDDPRYPNSSKFSFCPPFYHPIDPKLRLRHSSSALNPSQTAATFQLPQPLLPSLDVAVFPDPRALV
jgi:hypothetical protein